MSAPQPDAVALRHPVPKGALELVRRSRQAVEALRGFSAAEKDGALVRLAALLEERRDELLSANAADLEDARAGQASAAFLDRLRLNPERIAVLAGQVRAIAALPDPLRTVGRIVRRPNGMRLGRVRVPIGVILMIYESRPNVTIDAAALALKAGNAVILRGGHEALRSNVALGDLLAAAGFPAGAAQVVEEPDRELVLALLRSEEIDLVIPRGGDELIRTVVAHARMPVLKHARGVCHLFIDRDADPAMAQAIVLNAKTHRPSTCNALEAVLADRPIAAQILPGLVEALVAAGVEVRGDAETMRLHPQVVCAAAGDWGREFLDLILAVRVVEDLDEAIAHIHRYSSGLADGIVTRDRRRARRFLTEVDSAAVLVNASTRLVDGAEFGLGGEIGISTDRIGPRGPMGLLELTTTKWVVLGDGQVR